MECIPITKSSEEKQCSEFGRSESNYERFHGSSEDDSDEEYFHKSTALALSLYDCVLYKYFDAMLLLLYRRAPPLTFRRTRINR